MYHVPDNQVVYHSSVHAFCISCQPTAHDNITGRIVHLTDFLFCFFSYDTRIYVRIYLSKLFLALSHPVVVADDFAYK